MGSKMTKETIKNIADGTTAGSSTLLVVLAFMAWQEMTSIKTQLATHITQTNTIVEQLMRRVETLEKRVGFHSGHVE